MQRLLKYIVGPRSVSEIIKDFTKTRDELKEVADLLSVEVGEAYDEIARLEERRQHTLDESERARQIAANLDKIISG